MSDGITHKNTAQAAFDEVYGHTTETPAISPAEATDGSSAEVASTDVAETDNLPPRALSELERAVAAGLHPTPMFDVESAPAGEHVPFLTPVLPDLEVIPVIELERMMSPSEAAKFLGSSPAAIAKWRQRGEGPAYYKQGDDRLSPIRYRVRDLIDWRHETFHRVAARQSR